jgi:AmmeMemoRadiSam system protein B
MEFAGSWYPRPADACEAKIRAYWSEPLPERAPRGRYGVVPHAGWLFSGPIAGRVFQALEEAPPSLVIVLGGHLRRSDPVVAMSDGEWETPFGPFPIHQGFREELEKLPNVLFEQEGRHYPDNSTELQLPFARYKFPEAELLPLRVPPGPASLELGRRLAAYLSATRLRAAVVASTDLTHYGDNYGFEPKGRGEAALAWVREVNDPAFIQAVEAGEGEAILAVAEERSNACSAGAVAALNEIARAEGLGFRPLAYATSAEAGTRDTRNFVGYLGGLYC